MKRVIVSVTNDLTTDQRVHKVCTTLFENNFEILLIGRKLKDSLPINRNYKTKRIRLLFNKGFLFYVEFNLRLFFLLVYYRSSILLSNDLDTLLPNFLISKLMKKDLVFDSHELFSELPSIKGRYSQVVWKKLESFLIPKLKFVFTVSRSIAKWYKKTYHINSVVIKNLPHYVIAEKVLSNESYIIYQGALNKGRGLITLIKAMSFVKTSIKLKIVGSGPFKEKILNEINVNNLVDRIEIMGVIEPEKLVSITQKAQLGVSLEEDLGLSYRYSLPNKLFDYIQARIPVVTTYLPETKNVVNTYGVGEIIKSHNPKDIAFAIENVLSNGKDFYTANLNKASIELNWKTQEKEILDIFNNI